LVGTDFSIVYAAADFVKLKQPEIARKLSNERSPAL
jgi:hypothetical protein